MKKPTKKKLKLKEGLYVKAIFNNHDAGQKPGQELIGPIDNYEEYEDKECEPTYTLLNLEDGECYLVGISDIYEIVSKEIGKSYTFLGEEEIFGVVSGFDKMDPDKENKNPDDYKGQKCKVLQLISDGEDCGCVTYEVEFKDGETAVVLMENLK